MGRLGIKRLRMRETQRQLWLRGTTAGVLWCLVTGPVLHAQPRARSPQRVAQRAVQPHASQPSLPPAVSKGQVLPLSLEEAIRLAVQNNIDIERERFGTQIAHATVEQARAQFDPSVGLDVVGSRSRLLPTNHTIVLDPLTNLPTGEKRILRQSARNAEVTPNFKQQILTGGNYAVHFINTREDITPASSGLTERIADPRYESSVEVSLTQPLLRGFGIAINSAAIRQAQKAEGIAVQQVLQAVLNTIFTVQERYWELGFRMEDLAAKRESLKLAEDFLAENKIRVELGTLAPIELVQAETRVKTRQGDVIDAESAVDDADDLLKEVLNIPEIFATWALRLQPTDTPPFHPITPPILEDKVEVALQKRPDYIQSQLGIAAREIAREVAHNSRLPRLDLQGRVSVNAYGDNPGSSIANLGETEGYEWAVGVQLSYPLGNRFALNELHKRNLELQQARVEQRQLKRTIVRDLRQALRRIETEMKQVEVTRQATVLARTQLEAEQEKFRLGLSTSFNVFEFQEDLAIARSGEIRALSNYNVALARLDQLTGTIQHGDLADINK